MNYPKKTGEPTITTGRKRFSQFKWLLTILTLVLSGLPRTMRTFVWDMSRPFAGPISLSLRYVLLKISASDIGNAVYIGRNTTFLHVSKLTIGNNVSIHEGSYIDAYGGCQIGSDVSIAHGCSIVTFNHTWDNSDKPIKYNPVQPKAIHIEGDVWIGAKVSIMGGTTIRSRSIIAAGAVVTRDVEGNTLNAGIPARKLRDL